MASKRATEQEILQVRIAMNIAFPDCFAAKGGIKKPLKVGIKDDLLAEARAHFPALSRRLIMAFLRDYCGGHNYFTSFKTGAVRVDLQGNFSAFVSADDLAYAKAQLAALKAKRSKPKRKNPNAGFQQIGTVANAVVDRAQRLMQLREQLKVLQVEQTYGEMGDDFYYSSGRKAKSDAEISRIKDEIRKLEAA